MITAVAIQETQENHNTTKAREDQHNSHTIDGTNSQENKNETINTMAIQ